MIRKIRGGFRCRLSRSASSGTAEFLLCKKKRRIYRRFFIKPETTDQSIGTINNATILMILISGLIAGPAVSLYGSPTVSPVIAAL